jgi:predicted transcriptional regulator
LSWQASCKPTFSRSKKTAPATPHRWFDISAQPEVLDLVERKGYIINWYYQVIELHMATSLKIDDSLKKRIQHLAGQRRRSPHWIMLEAIRQYVEREEKREAFKEDALCAWQAYHQTGLHLTLEEADDWLAKLEAGEDAEPPKCHV